MNRNRLLTDDEINSLFSAIDKGFNRGEIQFLTSGFNTSIFGEFSLENELTFIRNDGHYIIIDLAKLKVYAPYLRIGGYNETTGETSYLTILPICQE